jgi:hypothetical protein
VYTEWNQGAENRAHRHANFKLAGRRPEGCSSRSTRNSCLKAGRDGAVRQFCLKAIDIDLAQQIKESQNSEAKATSCRFHGMSAVSEGTRATRRTGCVLSVLGTFISMIRSDDALPFNERTAQRLMKISEHPVLTNTTHESHLPTSWTIPRCARRTAGAAASVVCCGPSKCP